MANSAPSAGCPFYFFSPTEVVGSQTEAGRCAIVLSLVDAEAKCDADPGVPTPRANWPPSVEGDIVTPRTHPSSSAK